MWLVNLEVCRSQELHPFKVVSAASACVLLCRDPFFLDARAALAAFLWAKGDRGEAEGEWEALQQSGGNFLPYHHFASISLVVTAGDLEHLSKLQTF